MRNSQHCYSSSHIIRVIIICEDINLQAGTVVYIPFPSARTLHVGFNNAKHKRCWTSISNPLGEHFSYKTIYKYIFHHHCWKKSKDCSGRCSFRKRVIVSVSWGANSHALIQVSNWDCEWEVTSDSSKLSILFKFCMLKQDASVLYFK